MKHVLTFLAIFTILFVAGCDTGKKPAATASAVEDKQNDQDKNSGGLCEKHGVLESLCTKCNPALIPIFQSKGDWCAEHGFPKSICPICYPERGGKPLVDVSEDEAPADGTKVVLKGEDPVRLAGIATVKSAKGKGESVVSAPVVIDHDPARVVKVSGRAAGVVKQVLVRAGEYVRAQTPMLVIESATAKAEHSRLSAATLAMESAKITLARERGLEEKGISSSKEVQAAEQALGIAAAEVDAIKANMESIGADNKGRFVVKAPISGVVSLLSASLEGQAEPSVPLVEIVDTSVVHAGIALPENELHAVKAGMTAHITINGLTGDEFNGKITHIATFVDPTTRTVRAVVAIANPGGLLRANMYGQAKVVTKTFRDSSVVPRSSIQKIKSANLAFVRLSPNEFEIRRVDVASSSGDTVEISSGIAPGEDVVAVGSFLLKSETLKNTLGKGCCEVE